MVHFRLDLLSDHLVDEIGVLGDVLEFSVTSYELATRIEIPVAFVYLAQWLLKWVEFNELFRLECGLLSLIILDFLLDIWELTLKLGQLLSAEHIEDNCLVVGLLALHRVDKLSKVGQIFIVFCHARFEVLHEICLLLIFFGWNDLFDEGFLVSKNLFCSLNL
jgi:hypothetical protein